MTLVVDDDDDVDDYDDYDDLRKVISDHLRSEDRLITRDQIREELEDQSDEFSFNRAIDVRLFRLITKLKDSSKISKSFRQFTSQGTY